jgi:SAM-dependent methyltransferase
MATDRFVDAVHRHDLADVARRALDDPTTDAADRERAVAALAACTRIGERMADERRAVVALLREHDIAARPLDPDAPRQNHEVRLGVASPAVADAAAEVLRTAGFEPWERWDGGALASFHRFGTHRTVARTGDVSVVVRLVWRERPRRRTAARALVPTTADWSLVRLPTWAWWLYSVVRVGRLAAERVGLREPHEVLGPYLATPESLIDPLLDVAAVTDSDTVVDIGCGDGRFVVLAATRRGCRAVGVETSPELVERARRRAAPVEDRVRIELADARAADLSEATVVFAFLPLEVVADLLGDLLDRLRPGARLVVHEQSALPARTAPAPDDSVLVLADDAVTVAHCWSVDGTG